VNGPRELNDLPYAGFLSPAAGPPAQDGAYDSVHFDGGEYAGLKAGGSRFAECAFSSLAFDGGRLRRARFNDVWAHTVRWVGTDLTETDWLDAEFGANVLAGVELYDSRLHRAAFHHCKLDSVNFRGAKLREVVFADCTLRDVDFGGASLTSVSFPGSSLEELRLDKAALSKTDLRGATRLGIASGFDSLKGSIISSPQLMELAPQFAQVLGVTVNDKR
jgi:uncharacterized protein YjbI with pentapeptide repeats